MNLVASVEIPEQQGAIVYVNVEFNYLFSSVFKFAQIRSKTRSNYRKKTFIVFKKNSNNSSPKCHGINSKNLNRKIINYLEIDHAKS